MIGYAVAVIYALTNQPKDIIACTEHPLALFLYEGAFAVGKVVAYQLTALHAIRDKGIARACEAQGEGSGDLVGIKAGDVLVFRDDKIGGAWPLLIGEVGL